MERLTHRILPAEEGLSVGTVAKESMGLSDRSLRKAKGLEGGLLLDGAPVTSAHEVQAGQLLEVRLPSHASAVRPQAGPLSIVFENEELLVVDKPAGLPMNPGVGHVSGTLANYVAHHLQAQESGYGVHPLHRLDKDASGLVAFAKSGILHHQLQGMVQWTYQAWVKGVVLEAGAVHAPIGKVSTDPNWWDVCEEGKPAVTHYQPLRQLQSAEGPLTLLELRLETGRTHQIRIHMAHMGHPLLGDAAYGNASALVGHAALRCTRMQLDKLSLVVEIPGLEDLLP